jgi:hypothetical protein
MPLGAGPASAETFLGEPCVDPAPEAQFADRDQIAQVHLPAVDCAVAERLVLGFDENGQRTYRPADSVPRDQLATMVANTLRAGGFELPAPRDQGFTDIGDNVHRDNINALAQIGVVKGVTRDRYDPIAPVRRDQMASFLVQAAEFAYGGDMLDGNVSEFERGDESSRFIDVLPTNTHDQNIAAADRLIGVVTGVSDTRYAPDQSTRRDQMASFVVRLLDVTALPDSTLD